METCLAGNGKKFRLHGLVVRPDHVHLVLTPLADTWGPISLAVIMPEIKRSPLIG
jgi:REP element-mobilizing transposase RayT